MHGATILTLCMVEVFATQFRKAFGCFFLSDHHFVTNCNRSKRTFNKKGDEDDEGSHQESEDDEAQKGLLTKIGDFLPEDRPCGFEEYPCGLNWDDSLPYEGPHPQEEASIADAPSWLFASDYNVVPRAGKANAIPVVLRSVADCCVVESRRGAIGTRTALAAFPSWAVDDAAVDVLTSPAASAAGFCPLVRQVCASNLRFVEWDVIGHKSLVVTVGSARNQPIVFSPGGPRPEAVCMVITRILEALKYLHGCGVTLNGFLDPLIILFSPPYGTSQNISTSSQGYEEGELLNASRTRVLPLGAMLTPDALVPVLLEDQRRLRWLAPEVRQQLLAGQLDSVEPAADVWAVGALLQYLLQEVSGPFKYDILDHAQPLLAALMDDDPMRRPTATSALSHPFLAPAPSSSNIDSGKSSECKRVSKEGDTSDCTQRPDSKASLNAETGHIWIERDHEVARETFSSSPKPVQQPSSATAPEHYQALQSAQSQTLPQPMESPHQDDRRSHAVNGSQCSNLDPRLKHDHGPQRSDPGSTLKFLDYGYGDEFGSHLRQRNDRNLDLDNEHMLAPAQTQQQLHEPSPSLQVLQSQDYFAGQYPCAGVNNHGSVPAQRHQDSQPGYPASQEHLGQAEHGGIMTYQNQCDANQLAQVHPQRSSNQYAYIAGFYAPPPC